METLGKSIASVGERLDRVNSNSCGQSSLKVSDTVHVFIQQVQGDRNVIFCPLSERPYLKRQQRMIASLIPLSFLSLDSVAERLLNQVAEDSQTRLVSACTLPGSRVPYSGVSGWVAWQGAVHLRDELTGAAQ